MNEDLDRLLELADSVVPGPWVGRNRAVFIQDAPFIHAASPDVVRGLIERVKEAEGKNRILKHRANDLSTELYHTEARLRAAEEVVEAAKAVASAMLPESENGAEFEPLRALDDALRHYDEAVKE